MTYTIAASISDNMRILRESGNYGFVERAHTRIDNIMRNAPSGSGIDSGTQFLKDKSRDGRLVFKTAFHHMDSNGFYTVWTHHEVVVTPTFHGFNIRITGQNKNLIKDYLTDVFGHWLSGEYMP